MTLTSPPDAKSSYYPPVVLSWHIAGGGISLHVPLSIDLCDVLHDEDIVAIGEVVEERLKALYSTYKIARVLSWQPSAPAAETQTVVQEGQPPAPSPDLPAPDDPAEEPLSDDPAPADTPPQEQGQ
ncbi:hypothetical protein [[Kitasatospora] papulosa]|uniref:hypothetical protein n=1 Tax=[Kitasatospora] papulosa TaxID=1464011 RepID=UPI0036C42719